MKYTASHLLLILTKLIYIMMRRTLLAKLNFGMARSFISVLWKMVVEAINL
jgi:hypothetical protein